MPKYQTWSIFCITDDAKTFDNAALNSIMDKLGIIHVFAVPGHSQENALCEQVIQSLSAKLSMVIGDPSGKLDWATALPMSLLSINTRSHRSTGYKPFELVFGREAPVIRKSVARSEVTPLIYTHR